MGNQFHPQNDNDNCMDDDLVTLNEFSFCTPHGTEYCHKCPTDLRVGNNMYLEDFLAENVSEEDLDMYYEHDDRPPFQVQFEWMELDNRKPGCVDHQRVGCISCFDWGAKIIADIKAKKNQSRR